MGKEGDVAIVVERAVVAEVDSVEEEVVEEGVYSVVVEGEPEMVAGEFDIAVEVVDSAVEVEEQSVVAGAVVEQVDTAPAQMDSSPSDKNRSDFEVAISPSPHPVHLSTHISLVPHL